MFLPSGSCHHTGCSGGLFKSCRFITAVHACLKVPAKNSPALLFLGRGKAADCCCFSFFFFPPAQEEQSRGILGGNFQTRMHNSNKAAGLKETTCGCCHKYDKEHLVWKLNKLDFMSPFRIWHPHTHRNSLHLVIAAA